jgi:FkbM family methyltransferase
MIREFVRDAVRTASAAGDILANRRGIATLGWAGGRLVADVRNSAAGALFVHLLDLGVGRPLYTDGIYEAAETRFLEEYLRPGMTVVDVGANIGYIAAVAARIVGPTGCVLAIEPEPRNLALLTANMARNNYRQVIVCACAAGNASGTATLACSAWNMGDHRISTGQARGERTATVRVDTVDQLVARHNLGRVDLIKMDVQGYEPAVIGGIGEVVHRHRPTVLTEFCPSAMRDAGFSPEAFAETWLRWRYVGTTLDSPVRRLRSVADFIDAVGSNGPDDYVNVVLTPTRREAAS